MMNFNVQQTQMSASLPRAVQPNVQGGFSHEILQSFMQRSAEGWGRRVVGRILGVHISWLYRYYYLDCILLCTNIIHCEGGPPDRDLLHATRTGVQLALRSFVCC